MKGDAEVITMIALFFAGVAFHAALSGFDFGSMLSTVIAAAATLAAAYLGARFAFRLQQQREDNSKLTKEITALNLAIFELSRTYNKFYAFEKQLLREHRNAVDRHLRVLPVAGDVWPKPDFAFSELAFLLISKSPNILGELSMLQQDVAGTLDTIRQRSKLHVETLQPAVEKIGLGRVTTVSHDQIREAIGERNYMILQKATDIIFEGTDEALRNTASLADRLHAAGKTLFPGKPLISLTPATGDMRQNSARRA